MFEEEKQEKIKCMSYNGGNRETHEIGREVTTEVGILIEAINLLTASIITSGRGVKQYDTENYVDKRLEQLQREWKLEETGFVRLHNSCMQLKQSLQLVAVEADEAVNDFNRVNNLLLHEKLKVESMKMTTKKICDENDKLRRRNKELEDLLKQQREEKSQILRAVRKFIRKMREERDEIYSNYEISLSSHLKNLHVDKMKRSDRKYPSCYLPSSVTDGGCATLRLEMKQKNKTQIHWYPCFSDAKHLMKKETSLYRITFHTSSPGIQFLPLQSFQSNGAEVNSNHRGNSFYVCGFKGFRDGINKKPSFGARLIDIDGKCEDDLLNWTIADLVLHLKAKQGPIKMTFRDDPIPEEQMKLLKSRVGELGFKLG